MDRRLFAHSSLALFSGLGIAPALQAMAARPKHEPRSQFLLKDWDGPALTIHALEPETIKPSSPIVIAMHGLKRNPIAYREGWLRAVENYGFCVYMPEFDEARFPKSLGYNLGNIDKTNQGGSMRGHPSSFAAIEPLFDAIIAKNASNQTHYTLFGHSAGAQFVNRFSLLYPDARTHFLVAANAGWYTLPDTKTAWPYGLAQWEDQSLDLAKSFAKKTLIALGTKDNDPNHESLNKDRLSMLQGPHRLARGHYYFQQSKAIAAKMGLAFNWQLIEVPGIDHNNTGMVHGVVSKHHEQFKIA